MRRIASVLVVTIGWLYLLPQLVGAGLTRDASRPAHPAGWAACWSRSSSCSASPTGGMRSITFVQAFQYWLKLTALAVPVLFLAAGVAGRRVAEHRATAPPTFPRPHRRRRLTDDTTFVVREAVRRHGQRRLGPVDERVTTYDGERLHPGSRDAWRAAARQQR